MAAQLQSTSIATAGGLPFVKLLCSVQHVILLLSEVLLHQVGLKGGHKAGAEMHHAGMSS